MSQLCALMSSSMCKLAQSCYSDKYLSYAFVGRTVYLGGGTDSDGKEVVKVGLSQRLQLFGGDVLDGIEEVGGELLGD